MVHNLQVVAPASGFPLGSGGMWASRRGLGIAEHNGFFPEGSLPPLQKFGGTVAEHGTCCGTAVDYGVRSAL